MPALMRLNGAVECDPAIATWFAAKPGELRSLAQPWFDRMRRAGTDVRELMHDGLATVCVRDVPFAYIGIFKAHVNAGFYRGMSLPDPAGLLQGTGKSMRHVKLQPGVPVDERSLDALITAAYRDIIARSKAGSGGA